MKINVFLSYILHQIRFFIVGLIKPRYLTTNANIEINKLKKTNKAFLALKYSNIRKLLDFLSDPAFFVVFIGILGASICITQSLVLIGFLRVTAQLNICISFLNPIQQWPVARRLLKIYKNMLSC